MPDKMVVEGAVDGVKADDQSEAKDRHRKHKKHSKKHHKSSKSSHKAENGHATSNESDADRESGEIEGAPRGTVDTAATPTPRAGRDDRYAHRASTTAATRSTQATSGGRAPHPSRPPPLPQRHTTRSRL